jgi:hypothetical protein
LKLDIVDIAGNNGIMEWWNDGMMGLDIQE